MAGATREGSAGTVASQIEEAEDSGDEASNRDGSLRSKDALKLSQETLVHLKGAAAARAVSGEAGSRPAQADKPDKIASSDPLTSAAGASRQAQTSGAATDRSAEADVSGASLGQHISQPLPNAAFHSDDVSAAEPSGPIPRSTMNEQQAAQISSVDPQASTAQALYSAAGGQHPADAISSILSLIQQGQSGPLPAPGQLPLSLGSAALPPQRPPPPEAGGIPQATPLSATLQRLLQSGALKQEPPSDAVPHVQSHTPPQQVTTGDIHAQLQARVRPGGGCTPEATAVSAVSPGVSCLRSAGDGPAGAWARPAEAALASGRVQPVAANSGSEVLKRTFEAAHLGCPPNKRGRFAAGFAELQQILLRRAQDGSTGGASSQPPESHVESGAAPMGSDQPALRPWSQDTQAKDLTDAVRRDSGPKAERDSDVLQQIMEKLSREGAPHAAAAAGAPPPLDRGLAAMVSRAQSQTQSPPPPAALTAPAPRLSAHQLLQNDLIAEITGQTPRRLLDQLDPATLGLILSGTTTTPGLPPPTTAHTGRAPPEPLQPHDLQRMPRPPEHACGQSARSEVLPSSPSSAGQLYMQLEQKLGIKGASALLVGHGLKPPSAVPVSAPHAALPSPNVQAQLLDVLQSITHTSDALPPLHMWRKPADAQPPDAYRPDGTWADPYKQVTAASPQRLPLSAGRPSPHLSSLGAGGAPPASSVGGPHPSRRKQSPMLNLSSLDRSTGLRVSQPPDRAGLNQFGRPERAPELLTSMDLAKPVSAQLAPRAVDLRSGPAMSLALSLPPHLPAATDPAPRDGGAGRATGPDSAVSSIIAALTGTGDISPQTRQRTLAALGQMITEQGLATAESAEPPAVASQQPVAAPAPHPDHSTPGRGTDAPDTAGLPLTNTRTAASMTEEELQAAELLMALSGSVGPNSTANANAANASGAAAHPEGSDPAAAPPARQSAPEAARSPEATTLAVSTAAQPGAVSAAAPPEGALGQGDLGSGLAQMLLHQMMASLGMPVPTHTLQPHPIGSGQLQISGSAGGGAAPASVPPLLPNSSAAALQALTAAGQLRRPSVNDTAATMQAQQGSVADLNAAYRVESWRVQNRKPDQQQGQGR